MDSQKIRILFVGGLYPKHMLRDIEMNSRHGLQNAANNLQWNYVDGLDANLSEPVSIISSPYIGSYPRNHKWKKVQEEQFSHRAGAVDYVVGYNNYTFIKQISTITNTWACVRHFLDTSEVSPNIIILYSTTPANIEIARRVKKYYPAIKVVIVVPDLMRYTSQQHAAVSLRAVYRHLSDAYVKHFIRKLDGYVFLTEAMASYFRVCRPYLIVEGVADQRVLDYGIEKTKSVDTKKRIVYTGGLQKNYGIQDLLEAFERIDSQDYELLLCGEGEMVGLIRERCRVDSRIKYLGLLPRERVLEIQRHATLLVNPRKNDAAYTAYSFPSKVIEYMSSGTPVMCHKLDGIPHEYDEYLLYFAGSDVQSMSQSLVSACCLSNEERAKIGEDAMTFIQNNKVASKQMSRVLGFVSRAILGGHNA